MLDTRERLRAVALGVLLLAAPLAVAFVAEPALADGTGQGHAATDPAATPQPEEPNCEDGSHPVDGNCCSDAIDCECQPNNECCPQQTPAAQEGAANGSCGGTVFLFSGKEVYVRVDLEVPGLFPLRLERRYDSNSDYDSPLGYGWGFRFDQRLFEQPNGRVILRSGSGRRDVFEFTAGAFQRISPVGGRAPTLTDQGNGIYHVAYPDGTVSVFDDQGRLASVSNPAGHKWAFSYTATKQPLIGTSPFAVDPTQPMIVAYHYQIEDMEEEFADGTATGRSIHFDYDPTTGRLTSATTHDGRRVRYEHDDDLGPGQTRGNLERVIHELGGGEEIVATYGYDTALPVRDNGGDPHNLTLTQEGQGTAATQRIYDTEGRIVQETLGSAANARVMTVTYDPPGTTIDRTVREAVLDPAGAPLGVLRTTYRFDPDGYLLELEERNEITESPLQTEPLRKVVSVRPDSTKAITRREIYGVQAGAFVLERARDFGYDAAANRTSTSVTLDSGEVITTAFDYDAAGLLAGSARLANRKTCSNGGADCSTAAPDSVFRTERLYDHDPVTGVPTTIAEIRRYIDDDSLNALETLFAYDALNRLETVTLPDGHKIGRSYYPANDANFGRRGRLRKVFHKLPDDSEDPHLWVELDYHPSGFVAYRTTPLREDPGPVLVTSTTQFEYDALGRLVELIRPTSESVIVTYGSPDGTQPGYLVTALENGRLDPDPGQLRKFVYDARGNLTQILRNDGVADLNFATFAYDSHSQRRTSTDAVSRSFAFGYDLLRRLESVTDDANNPTQFAYDARNNRTGVTDGRGGKTDFVYDDLDRLRRTDQHGTPAQPFAPPLATQFRYDAVGNVTRVTDP
jgi:YD repeat-containing protein